MKLFLLLAAASATPLVVSPLHAQVLRTYSAFSDTIDPDVKTGVARLLRAEIAEGPIKDINGTPSIVVPHYWSTSVRPEQKRTIFVQLWGSSFCASGGCNTWILEKRAGSWRIATQEPFLSGEIALDRITRSKQTSIINWNGLGCAKVIWTGRAYKEGKYRPDWAYCHREIN